MPYMIWPKTFKRMKLHVAELYLRKVIKEMPVKKKKKRKRSKYSIKE